MVRENLTIKAEDGNEGGKKVESEEGRVETKEDGEAIVD